MLEPREEKPLHCILEKNKVVSLLIPHFLSGLRCIRMWVGQCNSSENSQQIAAVDKIQACKGMSGKEMRQPYYVEEFHEMVVVKRLKRSEDVQCRYKDVLSLVFWGRFLKQVGWLFLNFGKWKEEIGLNFQSLVLNFLVRVMSFLLPTFHAFDTLLVDF